MKLFNGDLIVPKYFDILRRPVLTTVVGNCLDNVVGERIVIIDDDDHVIAVFRENELWGAVAKSNTTTLRYRDPIYRSIRELALSYFPVYFNVDGEMSLYEYSRPFSLRKYGDDYLVAEDVFRIRVLVDAGTMVFGVAVVHVESVFSRMAASPQVPFAQHDSLLVADFGKQLWHRHFDRRQPMTLSW